MPKKKPVLEKTIEAAVVKYARWLGLVERKLNTLGHNHWPDRAFFLPEGRVFFIEFKRPGEKPTRAQAVVHAKLRALGFSVHVVDDADEGKRVVLMEAEA